MLRVCLPKYHIVSSFPFWAAVLFLCIMSRAWQGFPSKYMVDRTEVFNVKHISPDSKKSVFCIFLLLPTHILLHPCARLNSPMIHLGSPAHAKLLESRSDNVSSGRVLVSNE